MIIRGDAEKRSGRGSEVVAGDVEPALVQKIERAAAGLQPPRLCLDNVPWEQGPDPERLWIPESLAPLAGTAAYQRLTDDQRRRYNHYYALQMAEEFIWLERYMIIGPLCGLLRGAMPAPSMRTIIESFITDERSHTACLGRLVRAARPDLYRTRTFCFFAPPRVIRVFAALAKRMPRFLSAWTLLVGALEEQTITISRTYKASGGGVDPVFATVYTLHAQDESRHCRQDALIADWLVADQDGAARRLNAGVLEHLFGAYCDVGWGYDKPILRLVEDFPDLRADFRSLLDAAMAARRESYARGMLDRSVSPITSRNAERYPMLAQALRRVGGERGSSGRR